MVHTERVAVSLGIAGALVPLVVWPVLAMAAGSGLPASSLLDLVVVVGIPVVGVVLVLSGGRRRQPGLVVLAAFGALQVHSVVLSVYQLRSGMTLWWVVANLLAFAVPLAAGVAAVAAIRAADVVAIGAPRWSSGRALVAAGLGAVALAALFPSVTVFGADPATVGGVVGGGGIVGLPWPHVLFALLYPAVLVALAAILLAVQPTSWAAAGAWVLAAHSALLLSHALIGLGTGPPEGAVRLGVQPALVLHAAGVCALLAGAVWLTRMSRHGEPRALRSRAGGRLTDRDRV